MIPSGAKPTAQHHREDALAYLPRKEMIRYRRGHVIYDQSKPSGGIYLVIQGRVKVCATLDDGTQAALGIFGRDDFFGETGLLGIPSHPERATTLEEAAVMMWSRTEIEEQVEEHPRLGLALVQMAVARCLELETRLEALANDKTPARVARALAEFAERQGAPAEDGSVHVAPLTHQLIAEYVGTSREIVTYQMNLLRQMGYIRYSRRGIEVYLQALKEHLRPFSSARA
ncbi:MAG TPA: Crp/Fnr family transcriptional regulator [Bryobacteraceae bacterium]|nr:Crp/Fnr family transcriptional regulator [Bryobacteraceae bacterium]